MICLPVRQESTHTPLDQSIVTVHVSNVSCTDLPSAARIRAYPPRPKYSRSTRITFIMYRFTECGTNRRIASSTEVLSQCESWRRHCCLIVSFGIDGCFFMSAPKKNFLRTNSQRKTTSSTAQQFCYKMKFLSWEGNSQGNTGMQDHIEYRATILRDKLCAKSDIWMTNCWHPHQQQNEVCARPGALNRQYGRIHHQNKSFAKLGPQRVQRLGTQSVQRLCTQRVQCRLYDWNHESYTGPGTCHGEICQTTPSHFVQRCERLCKQKRESSDHKAPRALHKRQNGLIIHHNYAQAGSEHSDWNWRNWSRIFCFNCKTSPYMAILQMRD